MNAMTGMNSWECMEGLISMNKLDLSKTIKEQLPKVHVMIQDENPFLIINNMNNGIESLSVFDEGNEYTLVIKPFIHRHFEYTEGDVLVEHIKDIAKDDVAFSRSKHGGSANFIDDDFEKEEGIDYSNYSTVRSCWWSHHWYKKLGKI